MNGQTNVNERTNTNVLPNVYKARTKLRHARGMMRVFIRESLTNKRVQLYRETLQNDNTKSVWSQDGKIYALTKENRRVHINSRQDIEKL